MTVLVYGATAPQGRAIAEALISHGRSVRTLSRSPERARAALPAGLDCRQGNLEDPRSLDEAHDGVEAVVLTLPLTFDASRFRANGDAAFEAARRAGVRRLVYNTSVAAADTPVGDAVLDTIHDLVRDAVRSQISVVALRPPLFLENLLTPWTRPGIEKEGVLRYPLPEDLPIRWINAGTIGRAVSAALLADDAEGIFDIADDIPMTGPTLSSVLGERLGRSVVYEAIAPEEFASRAEPWFGSEGARHVASLYRIIGRSPGLFDRDYAGAQSVLGFDPVPSRHWIDCQFGAVHSTEAGNS